LPENEENSKEKSEEKSPSHGAGGMVSEKTLMENIKKLNRGETEVEIPPLDVLILLGIEKLHNIEISLGRIADAFEGKPRTMPVKDTVQDVAPETTKAQITSEPATLRIEEIVQAFNDVKDLVSLDLESSAQFVIIKPKEYLKDKWNSIMTKVRELGGEWVSQGKEGHWLVPKMSKQTKSDKDEMLEKQPPENLGPVGKIKILFPQDLEAMLTFEQAGEYIVIKPRQFLGSENFAKIASIVREANGEYISAGKESHFRIPAPK